MHLHAGVAIPGAFPEDYHPVIGMDVKSCVEHYNRTCGPGSWDVADVEHRVAAVKERCYRELTAGGIEAMAGVRAVVKELESLGIRYAIGSSGARCAPRCDRAVLRQREQPSPPPAHERWD